ncbi:cyclic diguanylate phosphodiesterase [Geomonas silvestris]|uniref:Cyclic diguanylate phosphodiesterase n=1 Tax=Geomonas silvestris TaxID=2740184 RepID=A0A6V8MF97_9BACT|nr:HD domain-containing phosphohydrolase [Geomonas silvestris]GFO58483.1 cyclic diguanylate phosphodiesterase [Geomonas silvestris]
MVANRRDELVHLGKGLIGRLFVLVKTSQNYPPGHAALESPVEDLLKVAGEIRRRNEEPLIRVKGHTLYLGDVRLKPDSGAFTSFGFILEEFARQGVGGVGFGEELTARGLQRFVYILRELEGGGNDRYSRILDRMQQLGIVGIELEAQPEETPKVPVDQLHLRLEGLKARLLYQRAAEAISGEMANAAAGKQLRLRSAKRVVQQMIDLMVRDEASLLGTCTPNRDWATRSHATNVCILSLAVGRRLGISKFTLSELGMAALFHDIGRAGFPEELSEREPALLTGEQRQQLESHPLAGVRNVMRSRGIDSLTSRIVTGAFEHHLLADFSGYPRYPYKRLGLFGRIISIADRFDLLTTLPQANGVPFPPETALRYLLTQAGKAYDWGLVKLFIGCLGLHPVGSLLQLDSGELAVVVGNHRDPDRLGSPRVKVIADPQGREVDGAVLDLADPAVGRRIVGTLDPNRHQIDVSRYLLAG